MLTKSPFILLYKENVQGKYISQHLGTKVRAIDGVLAKGMWAEVKSAAPDNHPCNLPVFFPEATGKPSLRGKCSGWKQPGSREEGRRRRDVLQSHLTHVRFAGTRNKPPLCEATERWGVSCYLSIA